MYKIVVYVPHDAMDAVKESMFAAGAGTLGNYCRCAWQCEGLGQFEAKPGAQPHCGEVGVLHREPEWRLEVACSADKLRATMAALKRAHPYEEPAVDVLATVDLANLER